MHIGLRIKELARRKNLTLSDIAKSLGKTKQTVYEMAEKEDVSTAIIKKLSQIYSVPITFFFDEVPDTSNTATASGRNSVAAAGHDISVGRPADGEAVLQERVKYLERLLDEKERLIKVYEKMLEK